MNTNNNKTIIRFSETEECELSQEDIEKYLESLKVRNWESRHIIRTKEIKKS